MRVVITGATGNVGTALIRALERDDRVDEIVGIARRKPAWRPAKTSWYRADIATTGLHGIFDGADAVIHLAWAIQPSRDEQALEETNVIGTEAVFRAALDVGSGALIHASSVGVYSAGPKDRRVREDWPRNGIRSSFYSRHKARAEQLLDELEAAGTETRIVRLRPGLIFQADAAAEVRRYFLGPFVPGSLASSRFIPAVPAVRGLRFQAVHATDVAEAYRLALHNGDAKGPFNIAADPVLDPPLLADFFEARTVPTPRWLLRGAAELSWRMRLQPTPPSWIDLGLGIPLMDTSRATDVLGWQPLRSASDALRELVAGLREGRGGPTPPLSAKSGGPGRIRELATGVGAR